MVTIDLHLISFIIVMMLTQIAGFVNILGVFNINSFHKKRGWVRLLLHFFNELIEVCINLRVILSPEVYLNINYYAESLRISSLLNHRSQCGTQLNIAVWGYSNKYLPIVRNRVLVLWLFYNLVEVDCKGIVVPLVRGHHLVQHVFALKQD